MLGAVAASQVDGPLAALLGLEFSGALTTYSTFGYETVRLAEKDAYAYAVANVIASIGAPLGAAFCGAVLAIALW